jgi:hypothetical protein
MGKGFGVCEFYLLLLTLVCSSGETDPQNIAIRSALVTSQLQQTGLASGCYISSGKATGVLSFSGDGNDSAQYKQRVCFLVQGSYSIYTLIRVMGGEDWWTLAEPVRVVAY